MTPSPSPGPQNPAKMSGDVRISGQLGSMAATSTNHHQQSSSGIQQQNRPWMQSEQTLGQPGQTSFDPAFVITHSGRVGSSGQQSAAMAFFAKKHQKFTGGGTGGGGSLPPTPSRHGGRSQDDSEEERMSGRQETVCNFSTILAKCPPPPPPSLIKKINDSGNPVSGSGVGKVKVILRVANSGVIDEKKSSFFKMDKKKKQVTLLAPDNHREHSEQSETAESPGGEQKRSLDVSAPKMFAFDGLYTDEDGQNDLSSSSLCDIIQAVVNGTDGTLFCFGHANLGKSYTMIGSDESSRTVGVIPTAVSWLYKCVREMKEKRGGAGARFSVRVSAAEISTSGHEEMRDLLSSHGSSNNIEQGPTIRSATRLTATGTSLQNLCEIRAASAEKAGYYLDAALSNRSVDAQGRDSHFIFTLHLYQHSVTASEANQSHVHQNILHGGRSRLHLIDFGCCERTKTLGGSITIAGLGNVILGILNGQRHLPFKESKVTQLLREVLGSVSCQVALLAHISPEPSHYSETLHTIQLASRIHRMRRKKMKLGGGSGGGSGSGGSSDENKRLGRLNHHDPGRSSSDMTTSTDPSSSEQSCDTVIYNGPRDDEGTDCESPPVFLPSLNSGDHRAVMSKVLKGSSAELPPTKYRSLDRKSARSPMSPMLHPSSRSPNSSQHSTPIKTLSLSSCKSPSNTGSLPRNPKGKMPLFGKVAGYRQPPAPTLARNDHLTPEHRLSISGSGISGRSRHSGSGVNIPGGEIWVDSKPICDKDLVVAASNLQYDNNAIYGYMDEHKKAMIQQWVEGQSNCHASSPAPPSHLTGKDSLAWLQAHSEARAQGDQQARAQGDQQARGDQQHQFRCLTQFKMAESSTSDCSDMDQPRPDMELCEDDVVGNVPSNYDDKSVTNGEAHPGDPDNTLPPASSLCPKPTTLSENKCLEGEIEQSFNSSPKHVEKSGSISQNLYQGDSRSIASKSSTSSKSDMATNTDEGGVPSNPRTPYSLRHQDPYGGSRKLTLRRTSLDQETGIKTLDELYNHCEQLVETLSQASEELRARETSAISQTDTNGIDDIEIYDVSEGSEVSSVEVSDIGCQATEEDIALCLESMDQDSGSEQHLRRILSQPDTSSSSNNGSNWCPTLSVNDESSSIDTQLRQWNIPGVREVRNQGSPDVDMADFDTVCEEVSGVDDHEEFFNKKFDQLEKLHELYKSVSSISAASQSRLELNKNRPFDNKNLLPGQRSASFSMSGLMLGDLDNLSLGVPSSISDDLNSLCSEPAWIASRSSQPLISDNYLDINRNSTSCTNSALDLVNPMFIPSNVGSALSLSQLMMGTTTNVEAGAMVGGGGGGLNKTNFSSQISMEQGPRDLGQDRSDSPILEGIDSDLAKYAKLKDLEKAYYKPKNDNTNCDRNTNATGLCALRHPDGSSNPDLGSIGTEAQRRCSPLTPATLPRRSPGTGRSSSGSDAEMDPTSQKLENASGVGTRTEGQQKANFPPTSASHHQHHQQGPEITNTKHKFEGIAPSGQKPSDKIALGPSKSVPSVPDKVIRKTQSDNVDSVSDNKSIKDQKEKTPKIPRFSRLFGNVKKISRSPTQITKGVGEKTRSKDSKRQGKTSSQSSLKESGQLKTEKLIADKPTKTKYRFFEKREKCFPKSPASVTKNVKGTLSSEQLFEKPKTTKQAGKNSPLPQKSDKKKDKVKTKNQGVCAVSCLPSPYSFPSKIKSKKAVASETSGSGYDSGIDSGSAGAGVVVAGIRSSSLVKIRGKGAEMLIVGSNPSTTANTLQLHRRVSRSHCKSSGYESIGLESESTSVDSYQGTLNVGKDEASNNPNASVQILQYDETTVDRMDRHWRFEEIKRLKKKQEHLKGELLSAKSRINSDPDRWSYELHTEASGLDPNDPIFVEAFEKETVILDKRVAACKSHVVLSTCFDNKNIADDKRHIGCTADCESYTHPSSQETGTGQV